MPAVSHDYFLMHRSIFQRVSQNATPATECARCHRLTQRWQCDSQKTGNTTRLKCCACHAKWRWRSAAKNATYLLKTAQIYCARRTESHSTRYQTCLNVTSATRNEAAGHLKPPKVVTIFKFCSTRQNIATSRGHWRTAAKEGCECGQLRGV